jgi:hypothetical protein
VKREIGGEMVRWAMVMAFVLVAAACAGEEGHRRRRHRRHRHRPRRPPPVVVVDPPGESRTRILRRVCAPVARCGQFAGCALAEEQPDPHAPGQVRYVVNRYDPEPARVGSVMDWGRLCWSEPSGRSCVDAFESGGRCPDEIAATPTVAPPRCEAVAGVCGEAPPPTPAVVPDAGTLSP